MTSQKADHLFVLAGYRGSGKTTLLRLARERGENFPIFPPHTMADFRRIPANAKTEQDNAGFSRYDDFHKLARARKNIMGVHYDLVMPIQNAANAIYNKTTGKNATALYTPEIWAKLLRKMLDAGHIQRSLDSHFFQLVQLSHLYRKTDISILMTDWEANRADWVARFEDTHSEKIDARRKFQRHSFNLALYDHDVDLGKRIYDLTHRFWLKALKDGGSRHFVIQRTGSHYDVKAVNFPTPTVSKK